MDQLFKIWKMYDFGSYAFLEMAGMSSSHQLGDYLNTLSRYFLTSLDTIENLLLSYDPEGSESFFGDYSDENVESFLEISLSDLNFDREIVKCSLVFQGEVTETQALIVGSLRNVCAVKNELSSQYLKIAQFHRTLLTIEDNLLKN